MELVIFFVSFIVLLLIGVPIYLTLIIPSVLYLIMNPGIPMIMLIQKMMASLNNFTMLAVPFFVLAGELMNAGSVADRIYKISKSLVGHFKGGLGYVNVLGSVIFSGMSGSAIADIGGLGQVEIKNMRTAGYDDDFIIGVTGASGTIGPIIPPSIPFAIYASLAGVSTGALFMAGFLPGLLMALVQCAMVYIIAKKKNYATEPRATLKELLTTLKGSFLALLMPVIIIGGIWTGYFTASEAALVAIIYAIVVSVIIYKDYKFKRIKDLILTSSRTFIPIMMIVAGATLFCWILNYEKLDQYVLSILFNLTDNRYVVLLLICVAVLILGMFFDPVVATLLFVPILKPLCAAYDINMIHIGVVIVLTEMIGLLTPPVGMSLFVLAQVTGHRVEKVAKMVMPWLLPEIITMLLITFFEGIVLLIPNSMGIG